MSWERYEEPKKLYIRPYELNQLRDKFFLCNLYYYPLDIHSGEPDPVPKVRIKDIDRYTQSSAALLLESRVGAYSNFSGKKSLLRISRDS